MEIHLYANAEMSADIVQARALGAAGIGLYRTEFLFLQRREVPDEEEQFAAYRDVVLGMGGMPVTIRTLDLGADKADGTGIALGSEPNPALGVRGVRLSMAHPQLFATQLRAILRAASFGPRAHSRADGHDLRGNRRDARAGRRSARSSCARSGHEITDHYEFGAMIEVPAAAIALPSMIRHLDFISIGTNDLTQYTLAVDRGNDALGTLYDPLHPAVLKLLAQIIATTHRARKQVTLCGEMAGEPRYTALLLALGLTRFSMHPSSLLEVRQAIGKCDRAALRRQGSGLLRAQTRAGIERVLKRMNK